MTLRVTVCGVMLAAAAGAACPVWMPQYGDARCAQVWTNATYMQPQPGMAMVVPPAGEWNGLTCTMWVRFLMANTNYNIYAAQRTTAAFWCPEPLQTTSEDITAGAWGYPDGTNLAGAASLPYTFTGEGGNCPTNVFPRGAYTVTGWSSNALTLTFGGTDITLGPGVFTRNALPGVTGGMILTGTGECAVGVGKIHAHQFFGAIYGVVNDEQMLTPESIVTNEMVFLAFRIRLDESGHVYRSDMCRLDWCDPAGQTQTNALPNDPAVRALSSRGLYFFGLGGLGPPTNTWQMDAFDVRIQPRWLENDEIERIYSNGAEEIGRREIPRWR